MLKNIITAVTFGIIISSCGISADKPKPIPSADTFGRTKALLEAATELPDTSNQYIYDFMKMVIAERELNTSYGLAIEPEHGCDLSLDDSVFLQTLLVEKKNKVVPEDAIVVPITLNELPKCFTKADVIDMLQHKKYLSSFMWDISRLGFSTENDKNWYCFSVPLFSKDRKKAVMMIRSLCPGLCGVGSTVLFKKENQKWSSVEIGMWIH